MTYINISNFPKSLSLIIFSFCLVAGLLFFKGAVGFSTSTVESERLCFNVIHDVIAGISSECNRSGERGVNGNQAKLTNLLIVQPWREKTRITVETF